MNEQLTPQIVAAIIQDGTIKMTAEELTPAISAAVAKLQAEYSFSGIVQPRTSPGSIQKATIVVAVAGGTYPGYSNQSVNEGDIIFLTTSNGGYWSKHVAYTAGGSAENLISGTWSEIKGLRDQGKLVPGAMYRITDYVATTTQDGTRSANHPFDIVVPALSAGKLGEEGYALPHEGDNYFTAHGARLEAWRVSYCLDNDDTRFMWADTENGKGVIYRLKDEWNNDIPYDFKGIQVLRDEAFWENHNSVYEDLYGDAEIADKWMYLFTWISRDFETLDASLESPQLHTDDHEHRGVHDNYMASVSEASILGGPSESEYRVAIPCNVFSQAHNYDAGNFYGFFNNVFSGVVVKNSVLRDMIANSVFGGVFKNNVSYSYIESSHFVGPVSNSVFLGAVESCTVFRNNQMELSDVEDAIVENNKVLVLDKIPGPIVLTAAPDPDMTTQEELSAIGLTYSEMMAAANGRRTGVVLNNGYYGIDRVQIGAGGSIEIEFTQKTLSANGIDVIYGWLINRTSQGVVSVTLIDY